MADSIKYNQILDALQEILENRDIRSISVSEIAQKAGIGKGSIYYYFPSKDAIFDALVKRNYKKSLETAKHLAVQTEISPFTRMAMLFEAFRSSSSEFLKREIISESESKKQKYEQAYVHQNFLRHVISELKPVLTEIIRQGIEKGLLHFDYPDALAEIVLIVLTIKIDNYLLPSTRQEIERTIRGLIALLEKGTEASPGILDFLTI